MVRFFGPPCKILHYFASNLWLLQRNSETRFDVYVSLALSRIILTKPARSMSERRPICFACVLFCQPNSNLQRRPVKDISVVTVCTVVQNCCKGDSPCQWKNDIYTLRDQKPLNRSTSNLTWVITSGTSPHMQTLVFLPLRGAGLHMREIVIIRVYFF